MWKGRSTERAASSSFLLPPSFNSSHRLPPSLALVSAANFTISLLTCRGTSGAVYLYICTRGVGERSRLVNGRWNRREATFPAASPWQTLERSDGRRAEAELLLLNVAKASELNSTTRGERCWGGRLLVLLSSLVTRCLLRALGIGCDDVALPPERTMKLPGSGGRRSAGALLAL